MELFTLIGGVLGVLEATLLVAGVTIVFVMDEGGADGTASTVNDGIKLFVATWHHKTQLFDENWLLHKVFLQFSNIIKANSSPVPIICEENGNKLSFDKLDRTSTPFSLPERKNL